MATGLTPEQMAQLRALASGQSMDIGGTQYQPYDMFGSASGMDSIGQPQRVGGYYGYDPENTNPGDEFSVYGEGGDFSNTGQFKDMSGLDPLLLAFLASAGGMAAFLPGGFMAGSAAGGTGGLGAGAMGDATAFGYGIPGEVAAGGGMGGGTGALGAAGAGAAMGTSGATSTLPFLETLSPSILPEAIPLMEGAGSGLLSTALKYGLPLAGAISGAQGQDDSRSSEKRMDPRLDPYVFGGNGQTGMLEYARKLIESQMAPGAMAGYDQMKTAGQGLLGRPMQGNGFNRFFPHGVK